MGYFLTLVAKYYYSDDITVEKLSDIIKKKISEFNLENYQEYIYHNKIITVCNGLFNGNIEQAFKKRKYIPIYESEIKFINFLPNDRQKKLMFTLFAVARYMDSDGWINKKTSKDISELFKLANINLTSDKRNELLHELYMDGYISFGKKINNLNIKVDLIDSGEVSYKIRDFHNIGNQYIGNFKKGYKQCKNCGKSYKIKSHKDYSSKYCNKCAYEIKLKQVNECKKRKNGIKAKV